MLDHKVYFREKDGSTYEIDLDKIIEEIMVLKKEMKQVKNTLSSHLTGGHPNFTVNWENAE